MQIIIKGKNLDMSDELKSQTQEKLGKVVRHHEPVLKEVEVELTVEKNPSIERNQTVEVTAFTKGHVIRAKESSFDMITSLDIVVDKLERQIEKYKGKAYASQNHKGRHAAIETKVGPKIVRVKKFDLKPMTPEEATLQMELLSHNFYVFQNADTGKISVIYIRRDNDFGLIEPA